MMARSEGFPRCGEGIRLFGYDRAFEARVRSAGARSFLTAIVLLLTLGRPVSAQTGEGPRNLEWWHPLAAGAGVATLMLVDDPVREFLQDHRSRSLDDLGDMTSRLKDREVYLISGGGAIAAGLLAHQPKVTVTGIHILAACGLSVGLMVTTKWAFGRSRPSVTPGDATVFDWFDGGAEAAFPSGSAAIAFSLATTLADAIDRRPVSILLYTGATLNAWARLNSNRHWLSDVALGGLYGITAAKLVNGEWSVFGLELPAVWTDGRATSMGYSVSTR
jgi:membrane-associated phospholipid phosphatase